MSNPYQAEEHGTVICPIHGTTVNILYSEFIEAFYVVDYDREMQAPMNDFDTVEEAKNAVLQNEITWESYDED